VMSVNPGVGGPRFIPSALGTVRQVRKLLGGGASEGSPGARPVDVSVDGGVKVEHVGPLVAHGASTLVAGSAIFNASDPGEVIRQMRRAAGN